MLLYIFRLSYFCRTFYVIFSVTQATVIGFEEVSKHGCMYYTVQNNSQYS